MMHASGPVGCAIHVSLSDTQVDCCCYKYKSFLQLP